MPKLLPLPLLLTLLTPLAKAQRPYVTHDAATAPDPTENPHPIPSLNTTPAPASLCTCVACGVALRKAKRANVRPDLSRVTDTWINYVHKEQFRLPDGTLARNRPFPNTLWGDDMYMSIPFLAQQFK